MAAMVVALAVGMEPARAAFPGSNGDMAYDSTTQVFLMNSDGFFKGKLPDTAGLNTLPDWSADGNKIAFASDGGGNFDIKLRDLGRGGAGG